MVSWLCHLILEIFFILDFIIGFLFFSCSFISIIMYSFLFIDIYICFSIIVCIVWGLQVYYPFGY